MAALITAASKTSAQGIFKVYKFSSVDTGDTFTGPSNPKAFWMMMTSDPSTQASAGSSCTESSGTYTFYPGEDGESASLFVIE